jgi:hypothetical protein
MESDRELKIILSVDTAEARREVAEFRLYALRVIDELRAAYASLGPGIETIPGVGRRV